jgi:hypothetical protein
MARADALGMFWQDEPKVKAVAKEKIKREPPFPFWLQSDYLPGLAEAQAFDIPLFTDYELGQAALNKERLVWDIESYPNYALIGFKSIDSGKVVYVEQSNDYGMGVWFDLGKLDWIIRNFCIVSFNGRHYDMPILTLALAGFGPEALWDATVRIIKFGERPDEVLKAFKVKKLKDIDHIDIKEVAPLHDSLKIYSGRLHTRRMQDLPFKPGTVLNADQMDIVRYYWVNDLQSTEELYNELLPAIQLREAMSKEYKTDVRSKSDAQVAEAVVLSGLKAITGQQRFEKPTVNPGLMFKYQIPHYVKYQTPLLNSVLQHVRDAEFVVGDGGEVLKPGCFPIEFQIADSKYTLGIGGLHSCEKSVTHCAGAEWLLIDRDVASFYPRVILTQRLYPAHLGPAFLKVYNTIVTRRLAAKDQAANLKKKFKGQVMPDAIAKQVADLTIVADSLKITINGSFGKFGNAYSMLYSPNLMIQVTLTGQLVLIMLIERLELAGIKVVSANTDGVVIKCHVTQKEKLDAIIKQWETDIDCQTEETRYSSTHNRDVNNYFAIKDDGEIKVKGVYSERGSAGNSVLSKNPYALIASDAVKKFLVDGTPVDHTIRACTDIRRFACLRYVKGGAVKVYNNNYDAKLSNEKKIEIVKSKGGYEFIDGYWLFKGESDREVKDLETIYKLCCTADPNEYLGKAIRWYYSTNVEGEIVNSVNGNKVSMTDNARPIMTLPKEIPEDMDYDWYIQKAHDILEEVAA